MKGICFKEPLFNATIEGRKNQTRRIMKPQIYTCASCYEYKKSDYEYIGGGKYCHKKMGKVNGNDPACYDYEKYTAKPVYQVGEKVYLREPYKIELVEGIYIVFFQFSNKKIPLPDVVSCEGILKCQKSMRMSKTGWCNKLFVVKGLAEYFPHQVEITSVRCERLQDISENDCIREGIIKIPNSMEIYHFEHKQNDWGWTSPIGAYAELIDKINGKGTWEINPYVWVYDYKLIK